MNFITGRDKLLFKKLSEFGFLSTSQINRLVFEGVSKHTVLRRLRKLKRKKLIDFVSSYKSGEKIWSASNKTLRSFGIEPYMKSVNKNSLEHDLLCNEVRMNLERLNYGESWISSHVLKSRANLGKNPYDRGLDSIPDWLVNFNFSKGIRMSALEVELHFKGKRRTQKVFEVYAHRKSTSHIWYMVPNEAFAQKVIECAHSFYHDRSDHWVMVSLIKEVQNHFKNARIFTKSDGFIVKDILKLNHSKRAQGYAQGLSKQAS
jgi:hypothetical protein